MSEHQPHPMIRGRCVYLRPAERTDLPTFVRWFAHAETSRNLGLRAPFSLAMEEGWFDRMLAAQGTTDYHFVICLLADGQPIGTTGLHEIDRDNGSAAFGISIGETDEWNKGYGTDAVQAICDFAFGELRLERVWLDVYADNARAMRSYEKAGFVHEGTLRHGVFASGEYHDVHRMGMLRDEWLAQDRPRSWELQGQR